MMCNFLLISVIFFALQKFVVAAPRKKLVGKSEYSYIKLGFDVHEEVVLSDGSSRLMKRSEILENRDYYENISAKRDYRKLQYSNDTSEISIKNNITLAYMLNVTLGVPRQTFTVQLDTGSSDLWVYSSSNPFCNSIDCSKLGVYDSIYSNTSVNSGESFDITYEDSSFAEGELYQDVLTVGNYTLTDFTFGVANLSNSSSMVLGIGLQNLESFSQKYDNFPLRLYKDGYIEKPVYSLYLSGLNATSGFFLAGAVDTSKFEGQLSICPLVNLGQKEPSAFYITSNGMNITSSNTTEAKFNLATAKHPLIFDSGSSELNLPDPVFASLGTAFAGISFITGIGQYVAECSILDRYSLTVDICGTKFDIPMSFLSMRISQIDKLRLSDFDASTDFLKTGDYCALQVGTTGDNSIIAGDALMRYFYVYYDVTRNVVGVAKANLNNPESENIVPVTGDLPTSAMTAPLSAETYVGTLSSPAYSDGSEAGPSKSPPSGRKGLTSSSPISAQYRKFFITFPLITSIYFIFV